MEGGWKQSEFRDWQNIQFNDSECLAGRRRVRLPVCECVSAACEVGGNDNDDDDEDDSGDDDDYPADLYLCWSVQCRCPTCLNSSCVGGNMCEGTLATA